MTEYERPTTAEEFLRVWYPFAEADNTTQLEQWERQFPQLAETAPDMTLDILRELAASDTNGAKEAAAIYARYVFHTRHDETTELLVNLFQCGDPDIQRNVLDTIDTLTTDPQQLNLIQTANLITSVKHIWRIASQIRAATRAAVSTTVMRKPRRAQRPKCLVGALRIRPA